MTPGVEVLAMFRAAVGAAVCIGTLAGPVSAQAASDVFYNDPDATLKQEIAAYVAMIDQLKTTGQPATVAGTFSFTNAAANSPLFDPYPAMRRTVNATLGNGLCWAVPNGTVVNYASTSTIASPLSDTPATVNHFNAIVDASQTDDVTFGFTGNDLVSQGIPVAPVSGTATPAASYTPDAVTSAWIFNIESHTIGEAISFQPATDVSNRLLGVARDVDILAYSIWEHTYAVLGQEPDDIVRLEATFGLFGSLPVLAVWYGEGYFLVDGTNGLVSGPYLDGTPYNAVELLLNHNEYIPGTQSLVLRAATGCEDSGEGPGWKDTPPPGINPNGPVGPVNPPNTNPSPTGPAVPGGPPGWPPAWVDPKPNDYWSPGRLTHPVPATFPPGTFYPGIPGRPTQWDCVPTSNGGTSCTSIEIVCVGNTTECYARQVTCHFDPTTTPPGTGTPPTPPEFPRWPEPADGTGPADDGQTSGNDCLDRWYY